MSGKPLVNMPNIGNNNKQCATQLAQSQGSEASSGANLIKNLATGQGLKSLNEITSGRITQLSNAVNDLLNEEGETLSKIRKSNLYNNWLNANSLVDVAKVKAIVAARNYYTETERYSLSEFETNYINPLVAEDASNITVEITTFMQDISNNFNNIFTVFDDVSNNVNIINNMLQYQEEKLFDVIGNIQLYEKKFNVDVRKNLYEFERTSVYTSIYNVIRMIYYGILVVYLIFGNFMTKQMYKNKTFYIAAVIYLLIPFSLKYIFAGIIYIYEYVVSLFRGNKPILSYSDIVRANNIENIYTAPVPSVLDKNAIMASYDNFVRYPTNLNRLLSGGEQLTGPSS